MQKIYLLIGEIIETSQVIEYNLVLLIKYNEYINKFKCKNKLSNKDFVLFQNDVDSLYNSLMSNTFGHIINKVKEINVFDDNSINKLYSILNKRNEIVHRFFKDNNFNLILKDGKKYNHIVVNLCDILKDMQDVSLKLYNIVKGQQVEFSYLLN